jgi:ABC-type transport system involved in multi-copper enzyme maturation permease subunit
MRNLILKDLILHRKFLLLVGGLYGAWMGYFGSRMGSLRVSIFLSTFLSCIIPLMIFTREDKFKAASVSCSLPVTRKQIVLSRYILSWALMLIVYALIVLIAVVIPGGKVKAGDLLSTNAIFLALALLALFFSILMPLLVRFGMVGMFVFLIGMQVLGAVLLFLAARKILPFSLKDILASIGRALASLNAHLGGPGYYLVLFGAMLVLSAASFSLSVFLFQRKDL